MCIRDRLQEWVDYANKAGAVIIYDAAYEAYISEAVSYTHLYPRRNKRQKS